jgi:hypothetical protein
LAGTGKADAGAQFTAVARLNRRAALQTQKRRDWSRLQLLGSLIVTCSVPVSAAIRYVDFRFVIMRSRALGRGRQYIRDLPRASGQTGARDKIRLPC